MQSKDYTLMQPRLVACRKQTSLVTSAQKGKHIGGQPGFKMCSGEQDVLTAVGLQMQFIAHLAA